MNALFLTMSQPTQLTGWELAAYRFQQTVKRSRHTRQQIKLLGEKPMNTIVILNDISRLHLGNYSITPMVRDLGDQLTKLLILVKTFNNFNPDNDPHGEHDFGSIEFAGETYFWKIDYYDKTLCYGSPNPADEAVTRRVITVMHSSEY